MVSREEYMKKTIALGIVFLLVLMSFTSISGIQINNKLTIPIDRGSILYVGGSGEGNYSKIQDAINNASDDDTVYVFDDSSPYYENLIVDKSIDLIGEDRDTTIIWGEFYLSADWVNISGFTIVGMEDIVIKICSEYNTIAGNNIPYGDIGIGIEIHSNYNVIKDNNISNFYDYGVYITNTAIGNIILGNNISALSDYGDAYGIFLDSSNRNNIMGNTISHNFYGIFLEDSYNNTISGNNIIWNVGDGMVVRASQYNNILGNNFVHNEHDLGLYKSNNNTISGNIFSETHCCRSIGIRISNNNYINNNIITTGGVYAINLVDNSYNNTITGNIINCPFVSPHREGIKIMLSCCYNTIINNTITNNGCGIYIDKYSHNNSIYHNNLVNNTESAYDECDNIWDDGKYGNFWSDYEERYPNTKPKLFKPWMWNTPYEIPGGSNKDNCPLIKQWPNTVSKDITKSKAVTGNMLLLRILERFPLLQKLVLNVNEFWKN